MKLPLKFLEKKEPAEYYLALVLRNEKATSVIFEKIGTSIKYISHGEEEFENTIEDADTEQFLNVLDKVITSAETALPENIETHKTIFGLKENWIEDNKIKKEYLEKLKKACDELSLDPIGFLVFSESIVNLVQKDEGAPVTAILADIGKRFITVSLVKAGKIIETKSSEIHQSPSYTVDTLLKHFQAPEVMPSRIILFDSEEEELTQEFIGHQWSKSLPFLHLPQILSLPADASIKAMLLGAATQMKTELLFDSRIDINEEPKRIEPEESTEPATVKPLEPEEAEETKETPQTEAPALDYVDHDNSMEYFGFVENEDIARTPLPKPDLTQKKIPTEIVSENIEEIPEEQKFEEEKKNPVPVNAAFVTLKIKEFILKLILVVKKIKLGKVFELINSQTKGNKKILIVPLLALLLIIVVLYFYLFTTKAAVTIFVSPKSDEKTTSVTFSTSSPTDIKNGVISTQFVSVSENGSATTQTSGNKAVGTPAKGTVTVFNNDSSSVTFPAGTTITSSNGLKFTLDNSVTVASSSGDIFSGTTPGTASVKVTAADIGQEYNLPSGTKFAIGSSSTAAAKNDNAFSGGTKKQVTVVSKDDVQKLLDALPKQLENNARNDIKGKIPQGNTFLSTFVSESVDTKNFDKNVGDQANQVTLTGSVTFEAATYSNSDILNLANSLFNSSGSELGKNNLNVTAKNITVGKNKDVSANLDIKAQLLPKIDQQSLAKQIAGVSLQKAENMLSNISQVQNVTITLKPNIPLLPKNLPQDPKNITITITSN